MRIIKINKLKLSNFKGVQNLEILGSGKDLSIFGENGTGKTTVFDAFMYLLFDKDSNNSSKFNIKTLDEFGQVLNRLEHKVYAELSVDDEVISLEKVYTEKWTRKRGEEHETLTGHTTDYFINEIPKKKNEYEKYLQNLIDEETFRVITNPLYFNDSLKWQDRRKIALELISNIESDELLENDRYEDLKQFIEKGITTEELKKKITSEKKALNKENIEIPGRIDELKNQIVDEDTTELETKRKEIQEELKEIEDLGEDSIAFRIRAMKGSIKVIDNDLIALEQDVKGDLNNRLSLVLDEGAKLKSDYLQAKSELEEKQLNLNKSKSRALDIDTELEKLRNDFKELSAKTLDKNSLCCPTCNQALPGEKIEEISNKFEIDKKSDLEMFNIIGKDLNQEKSKLTEDISTLENLINASDKAVKEYYEKLQAKGKEKLDIESKLNNLDVESSKEYQELKAKKDKLVKDCSELENKLIEEVKSDKAKELKEELKEIDKEIAKVDLNKDTEKRIEELKVKAKEVSQEILRKEYMEDLINQYEVEKVSKLEEELNSKFEIVKFKLFESTLEGNLKETFETTVDGVPYSDLNTAMTVNAGLDIIKTLSEHYQVQAPIFLDNRESVTDIPVMNAQIINLIVSSEDKDLRVEVI